MQENIDPVDRVSQALRDSAGAMFLPPMNDPIADALRVVGEVKPDEVAIEVNPNAEKKVSIRVEYSPRIGSSIDRACTEAAELANKASQSITFDFNDTTLTANPSADAAAEGARLVAEWTADCERKAEAYRRSPEAAAYHAKNATDICIRQHGVNAATAKLSKAIRKSGKALLTVLREIAVHGDHVGVRLDSKYLIRTLERFGYRASMKTDLPSGAYDDRNVCQLYIVGQVLACLKMGMPPHPITGDFIDTWMKRHG